MIVSRPATSSAPVRIVASAQLFFPSSRRIGLSSTADGGGTSGVPYPEEGLIDQNRHTRGDGRAKTPAQSQPFAGFGRVAIIVAARCSLHWPGSARATRSAPIAARRARACRPRSSRRRVASKNSCAANCCRSDQTLRILEYEWQRDPDHFDLAARSARRSCCPTCRCNCSSPMRTASCGPARARRSSAPTSATVTTSAMRRRCRPTTARCSWVS